MLDKLRVPRANLRDKIHRMSDEKKLSEEHKVYFLREIIRVAFWPIEPQLETLARLHTAVDRAALPVDKAVEEMRGVISKQADYIQTMATTISTLKDSASIQATRIEVLKRRTLRGYKYREKLQRITEKRALTIVEITATMDEQARAIREMATTISDLRDEVARKSHRVHQQQVILDAIDKFCRGEK